MPVDNQLYDRMAPTWWDDANPLALLRTALNPVRLAYFHDVVANRMRLDPGRMQVLEVGCGGGFLAEELTRLGHTVTAVDPSAPAIAAAKAHATLSRLDIDYRVSSGELLPFATGSFDAVYCCDVLEHVRDLDAVLAETARVLRPGAPYLYDTINRTWLSKLLAIKAMQEWRPTRFFDTNLHDWEMFITPEELDAACAAHGLDGVQTVGLGLRAPVAMLAPLWELKRGRIDYAQFGRRVRGRQRRDTRVSYMGYALRRR